MDLRRVADRPEIVALDGSRLRELVHPERDGTGLPYSVAVAWVDPGCATAPHRLHEESELYYVVRGRGRMHVGAERREIGPGDAVLVPAGVEQWVECAGAEPLEVLLVVSPPWRAEHDERA